MGELTCVYRQNLATLVVTTRWTGGVPTHTGAALRALGKLRSMPAVRRLAGAQAHFGGFAFWNSHKIRLLFLSFFGLQTIQNAPWRVARRLGGIAGRL
jgi:hypothetical protein